MPLLTCCATTASRCVYFFFFNDTATTEIYTLSLHDALPISDEVLAHKCQLDVKLQLVTGTWFLTGQDGRSEEHTSELQSPDHLVCRLLLEKKNNTPATAATNPAWYWEPQC